MRFNTHTHTLSDNSSVSDSGRMVIQSPRVSCHATASKSHFDYLPKQPDILDSLEQNSHRIQAALSWRVNSALHTDVLPSPICLFCVHLFSPELWSANQNRGNCLKVSVRCLFITLASLVVCNNLCAQQIICSTSGTAKTTDPPNQVT